VSDQSKYRILIVDDEEDVRTILSQVISKEYEVLEAYDGLDALHKLRYCEPDLVVLDVMMPLMDGFKACEAIRRDKKFHGLPVMFLTALNTKPDMMKGYGVGANLYLTKPFDPDRLLKNIKVHFESGNIQPGEKKYTLKQLQDMFERVRGLQQSMGRDVGVQGGDMNESVTGMSALYGKGFMEKRGEAAPDGAAAEEAKPKGAPAAKSAGEGVQPRVMVVDDEEDLVELITQAISDSYEVISAIDGIEAIERIVNFEPDIILIDAMMPRMSGFQLCQSLKRNVRFAKVPIVFISAKATEKDIAYAKRIGAREFLAKPFEIDDLLSTLAGIANSPEFVVHKKRSTIGQIKEKVGIWDRERRDREEMRQRDTSKKKPRNEGELEKFLREVKDGDS
jgi:DNA-binding response OmpR family regulator